MSILKKLKPGFLDHKEVTAGPYRHHFDFQRIWKQAILVTATVALVPLIIWAISGYRLTMETIESELVLRTSQLISNSWRSVSLFLTERRSVLDFIAHDHTLKTLKDPARLAAILENLNKRFGGFTDLGIIDSGGKQITHAGLHQMGLVKSCAVVPISVNWSREHVTNPTLTLRSGAHCRTAPFSCCMRFSGRNISRNPSPKSTWAPKAICL